jgi:hypothetical protein
MPILPGSGIRVFDTNITADANFFKGVNNLQTIDFDPLVTGYAFIVWTKVPKWVEKVFPNFANFTQKNFLSFGGLQDLDLNTGSMQQGFAANEYFVPTNLQKQNTDFTLKHQEFSGSPVKNMYQFWVTGIRDPETGIATYPAMYNCDYAAKNHTGELLYIMTRPDASNIGRNNIEFAAYYTNVLPTKVPLGHLNFELGSHDPQTIEMPFKATMHLGPKVDAFAKTKLNTVYAFREESLFDPETSNTGQTDIRDSTDFNLAGFTSNNIVEST